MRMQKKKKAVQTYGILVYCCVSFFFRFLRLLRTLQFPEQIIRALFGLSKLNYLDISGASCSFDACHVLPLSLQGLVSVLR
jgi:hypothetical protein